MPYKDKDKQREANKERQRRYRAKDVTPEIVTPCVTPKAKAIADELVAKAKAIDVPDDIEAVFATLPDDVQASIDSLQHWCSLKGVYDDRALRITRARHYQDYRQGLS